MTYILILLASILMNYVIGYQLGKKRNKSVLTLGIILNLGLLFFYKYCSFFIDNLLGMNLLSDESLDANGLQSLKNIHLPLGISFFTFQGVSYLIDVYREHTRHERNLLNLGMYIAMFPQLIAGPIVRFKTFHDQIRNRKVLLSNVAHGAFLFMVGLSYKVLIANNLAVPVDRIFAMDVEAIGIMSSWAAILAYTFQIYFDFCGYSTMAIGLGLMLGFKLPVNFRYPYISASITEFWRRWHITLSQWFRDYLYIPLGGNRKSSLRTYLNLWIVFLLCGIWHGASWTFLYWGIFHGSFLVLERLGWKKILDKLPRPLSVLITFFIVVMGWVLFRAETLDKALVIYKHLFTFKRIATDVFIFKNMINQVHIVVFILAIILSTPLIKWILNGKTENDIFTELSILPKLRFGAVWWVIIFGIFIITLSAMSTQTYNPFIYYRF
jgi:alginate O-acetyltransferase complex protein AlgI